MEVDTAMVDTPAATAAPVDSADSSIAEAPAALNNNEGKAKQQQQQQQQRKPALKGEDAWKRMNFLYQSAHHLSLLPHATLSSNLARFYLLNMRKIASKLVLRLDPCVKNTMCKRCGALLLPGHTAQTIVVNEGTPNAQVTPAQPAAAMSAEEAELMREWRQDQATMRARKSIKPPTSTAALASDTSIAPPPAAAPSPADRLTSKQRRIQRRAEASLAKLHATATGGASTSSSSATSAAPAVAVATTSPAAPTSAANTTAAAIPAAVIPSVAASASPVTSPAVPAPAAVSASSLPAASAPRGHRQIRRKHRGKRVTPAPPHVLTMCLLCNTAKRIHTKPPKQRAGAGE